MRGCAKVNLFLHVTGKRQDGYHLLQSLVLFADIGDEIFIQPAECFSLTIMGEHTAILSQEDSAKNLVSKAAFALAKESGRVCDVAIALHKNLPIGAGLGGGSADAAATLRALNTLWSLNYSLEKLATIGAQLGADIPACVHAYPLLMEGVGEKIQPIEVAFDIPVLLVNPRVHSSTPEIFRAYNSPFDVVINVPPSFRTPAALMDFLRTTHNALQTPATSLHPKIASLLEQLYRLPHCQLARMSGSGATCFALFDKAEDCMKAAEIMQAAHPDYWIRVARLKGSANHG